MGAQDRTEKVLRDIHVLFSKAEPYNGSKKDVVVDKNQMMDLLKELNECMYDMMDEHELSQRKKDKANREMQKQGDDIIFAASRKAEDIYAASIMYTDNALRSIQDIIADANKSVEKIFSDTKKKMDEERRVVKDNQSELKSQLEDLIDTQKYLRLIEEENRRLQQEKDKAESGQGHVSTTTYASVQPEIRINKEYFLQNGIPLEEDDTQPEQGDGATKELSEEELKAMAQELDNEYFEWRDGEDQQGEEKKGFSLLGKILDKKS
ncbi:MAG: hypothetical protein PUB19_04615 [Lachnospiraceae bacterium]|nr:hypothetical protein [Lachnospiraceae bacterium]